jgi:integrase
MAASLPRACAWCRAGGGSDMARDTHPLRAADMDAVRGLRQKQAPRSPSGWRVWWEPSAAGRESGLSNVPLDADRPAWSVAQAKRLNTGQKNRLKDAARGTVRSNTVEALANHYLHSKDFADLRPKTQQDYTGGLRRLVTECGHEPLSAMTVPRCVAVVSGVAIRSGDHMATKTKRIGSLLFAYAERQGFRAPASNPWIAVRTAKLAPRNRVCSWSEFDALMDAADALAYPDMALAMSMIFFHGARVTDVRTARLGEFRRFEADADGTFYTARLDAMTGDWQSVEPDDPWHVAVEAAINYGLVDIDTAVTTPATAPVQTPVQTPADTTAQGFTTWHYQRSKRGNAHSTILRAEVAARLEAWVATLPAGTNPHLFPTGTAGLGLGVTGFHKHFFAVRAHAARKIDSLSSLQMRDLRRSHAVHARRGGATLQQAGDGLGNTAATNPALEDTYMPQDLFTGSAAAMQIKRPTPPKRQSRPGRAMGE